MIPGFTAVERPQKMYHAVARTHGLPVPEGTEQLAFRQRQDERVDRRHRLMTGQWIAIHYTGINNG